MKMTSVQKLYHLGHARWYDFFRKMWTRIVEKSLEKDFLDALDKSITSKTRIVEIGCGTGINISRILSLQKEFQSYCGIDFSPNMLAIAKEKFGENKKITFVEGDIRTVSLPKSYDLVLCTWVLSHLPEPALIINRVYKNLNKDGVMLLVFLTKPAWYIGFLFTPLTRLFYCTYVSEQEIERMKGKKEIRKYAVGLATFVVLQKI